MTRTRTVTPKKREYDKKLLTKKCQNFIKQTKKILDLKSQQRLLEKATSAPLDDLSIVDKLQEVDKKLAKLCDNPRKIEDRLKRDYETARLAKDLGYHSSKYLARSNKL